MKSYLLLLSFLLLAATLPAQEKGAAPLTPPSGDGAASRTLGGVTRAVVVGISDYQDNGIPDLQYADRDAEAFAAWLRSPAGGNVPERNLVLLTNGDATLGKIVGAFTGLIADAREGEQVIIYFSGHGDVEANLFSQPGYLLCHDSKASVYMAGAFNIRDFQEVVNTLSLQNKARVLVITDACHAGKLAGSSINGAQLTSANLAKQFTNETKILSCQPSEYSLEGPQWGGGRGVFSYHLVDGLTGIADRNQDDLVTLFELEMYLGEKVPEETAPHRQFPFAIGDKTARMARVDAPALAALRQAKSGASPVLGGTDMRGWEDDLVATTDSATQALYSAYKSALKHGALIDTAGGYQNAWTLLPQLLQRESLSELHGLLRRNLAAALQDEAQQALNALLDDDPYEQNQWLYNPEKYSRYPDYLERAIELLGERHYMYRTLMAKKLFFEAKNTNLLNPNQTGSAANLHRNMEARTFLTKALEFEPEATYLIYSIGNSYINDPSGVDSFFHYQNKAIALAPTWMMPRIDIASAYLFNYISEDWESCEAYFIDALRYKPDSYILTERLAWLYQRMGRTGDVVALCEKMNRLRPDLPNGFATLSTTYSNLRLYNEALDFGRQALRVDSMVKPWILYNFAQIYARRRQYEESLSAEAEWDKGLPWFTVSWLPWNLGKLRQAYFEYCLVKYPYTYSDCDLCENAARGRFNFDLGKIDLAKRQLLNIPDNPLPDPTYLSVFTTLGRIYWLENQPDSAEYYLKKAVNYHPKLFTFCTDAPELAHSFFYYGRFLIAQNRFADAEAQLRKAEEIDPRNPLNYYGMAALHAAQKHDKAALDWLAKALEWYYPDYDEIMAEPLFKKIRKTKRFKALMKQYFPDGSDVPKVEALARKYLPEVFGE